MSKPDSVVETGRRGQLKGLRRRIFLTYQYHGLGSVLKRIIAFPPRFTPSASRLKLGRTTIERRRQARTWFARHGRQVTVVIPSFGRCSEVARAVRRIRGTTSSDLVRIVVCDCSGEPGELVKLRTLKGTELVAGEQDAGFAVNANRGLAMAGIDRDVVLFDPDLKPMRAWLECLQYAAYGEAGDVGIVGARLLYPSLEIQHAGVHRDRHVPDRFEHYYRLKPLDYGLADVPHPVLAVTDGCMYLKRELIEEIGLFDPGYLVNYEDVDLCLRAWEAGYRVAYEPGAILERVASLPGRRSLAGRELASRERFWGRWTPFFENRHVRASDGCLRIIYVTEGTGVWGGHRLVFEDINCLRERGHEVSLYTLDAQPDWFDLRAPVHTFADYDDLARALAPADAIKIATWWRTAPPVWRASVIHGIPIYLVQDIETTYYPDGEAQRHEVLASYREEFRYLTTSKWNRSRLTDLNHESTVIPPGVDFETFHPIPSKRRSDMVLAIGRTNPLKRFDLTVAAWAALPEPRAELCVFGVEPGVAPPGSLYVSAPTDERVNELLNECTVFVQTSSHEGFALPPLEAMAAGAAVVCTDADGNRDYCVDGVNCLMPAPNPKAIAIAIQRVLDDPELRARLGASGIATAREYGLGRRAEALEDFVKSVATSAQPLAAPRG